MSGDFTRNCFVCFFVLLSVTLTYQQESGNKIDNFFYKRCYNNSANAVVYDKLKRDTLEFIQYAKYTFRFLPNDVKHFCSIEKPHLIGRVKEISMDLEPCLLYSEKYLPGLFQDFFNGFLRFLCHNNGEYVNSFFASQGQQCRNDLGSDNELSNCFSRIFAPTQNYVKKTELCEDMDVVKKCFSVSLEKKCPGFKAFQELNYKFFQYITHPCRHHDQLRASKAPVATFSLATIMICTYILRKL